jgi:hypothetical protein
MIISLVIVIPGVALLLVAAFAGLFTHYGRKSDQLLVAPPNAGFGTAARLLRAEATRERARADLKALTTRKAGPALVLVDAAPKSGQRAA